MVGRDYHDRIDGKKLRGRSLSSGFPVLLASRFSEVGLNMDAQHVFSGALPMSDSFNGPYFV
jgi:hypothetical protein